MFETHGCLHIRFVFFLPAVWRSGDGSWSAATSRSWLSCCHPTWVTLPVSVSSLTSATSSRALWTKYSRWNGLSRVRKSTRTHTHTSWMYNENCILGMQSLLMDSFRDQVLKFLDDLQVPVYTCYEWHLFCKTKRGQVFVCIIRFLIHVRLLWTEKAALLSPDDEVQKSDISSSSQGLVEKEALGPMLLEVNNTHIFFTTTDGIFTLAQHTLFLLLIRLF